MSTKPETMDAETLEALRGSIRKWEGIVAGTVEDSGAENCPLCQMFNASYLISSDDCNGCPVFAKTGLRYCKATPYDQYVDAEDEYEDREVLVELAQAELDFLKSLLPEGAA